MAVILTQYHKELFNSPGQCEELMPFYWNALLAMNPMSYKDNECEP